MRKQSYLVEEILSKGYNKANFAAFLTSIKENGMDIDNWTFEDLSQAVDYFKQNNQPDQAVAKSYLE